MRSTAVRRAAHAVVFVAAWVIPAAVFAQMPLTDHFKCYDVARGTTQARKVVLEDQFEKGSYRVLKPVSFCNPVSKNGEEIRSPMAHLTCYTVQETRRRPPRRSVLVRNQFGSAHLQVGRSRTLCLPTFKGHPPEVDEFPTSRALITIPTEGGVETVEVSGPTTVHVFVGPAGEATDSDGDGRDQVRTEIVALELTGHSSLGPVRVRRRDPSLHPNRRSTGEIEETANTQRGRLDLPPFAEEGSADSFFEVFFEVEIGGRVLHSHEPKRMRTRITEKPPAEGETYEGPEVIELFDEMEKPTGIRIANTAHTPRPPEVDRFPDSRAQIVIPAAAGEETVEVSGPTTVHVSVGPAGEADDTDEDGRDQVRTEIVALELTGESSLGPVTVRRRDPSRHPNRRSTGEIEETDNLRPGRLDLPPFAEEGSADSFFNIFFEVEIGGRVLHSHEPKRMRTRITEKPPAGGETYEDRQEIELFDEEENPTRIRIANTAHTPRRPPEVDRFPDSRAEVLLLTRRGLETVEVSGPTTVHVFVGPAGEARDSDGDGRDQVQTEIVALELTGSSSLGPVTVRRRDPSRHPNRRSTGEIEEVVNSRPGRLDLPPFAGMGSADSFFDVLFEVEIGGRVLHSHVPKHMRTRITEKPPAGGETYEDPQVVELFDEEENPTEIRIANTAHMPRRPPEVDVFPDSQARIVVPTEVGKETVEVSGPTTVHVFVGPAGEAGDSDGNGRDQVQTEIVALELTGTSSLGPVTVRRRDPGRHPNQRSTGEIEETANTRPGRLDLPPFAETGSADSFFNVFFEVEIGGRVLHSHEPKRMRTRITEKPPAGGETYEGPQVIELFDEHENPTGIQIADTAHMPRRPPEVDEFPDSRAEIAIPTATGVETVEVSGPTTVHVFVGPEGEASDSDGDGRDQVQTEIVALELTGTSSLGPVTVRRRDPSRHPNQRSTGEIEETANSRSRHLDLPPFAETGSADSFFDIFFEVEIGGQVLHSHRPKHMRTRITEKPPAEGETYEGPQVIELYDESERPTGIRIARTAHTPRPPEIDKFPDSRAQVVIPTRRGTETVEVEGPTTVHVFVGPAGEAGDSDGDGRDQVRTEIVALELTGSSSQGPVTVRRRDPSRHPNRRSTGAIEERNNVRPGRLDLPPFAETGSADSFFDVYFEVEVGGRVLHSHEPKHMRTRITEKPPAGGETYEAPQVIELFDEDENPTSIRIANTAHMPRRPPEVDVFPDSRAQVVVPTRAGEETVEVRGPTTVHVFVGPEGEASDSDGDHRDQVQTEIVALELSGASSMGPVTVRRRAPSRHPNRRSTGEIEETTNVLSGRLDLPPFAETGSADSFFNVYFEVEIGGRVLHSHEPKHMHTRITEKPPAGGETYENPQVIELFDEDENPTEIRIANTAHTPRPVVDSDTVLYGVEVVENQLWTLDPTTGAGLQALGSLGDDGALGLACTAEPSALYAVLSPLRGNSVLLIVSTQTGQAEPVGDVGFDAVRGLAYDRQHEVLYAITYLNELLRIDPATGRGSLIGAPGPTFLDSLAYDPERDVLYAVDIQEERLYTVNPHTGKGALVGPIGFTNVSGLAYDADAGILYGSARASGQLVTIDVTTGAGSVAGSMPNTGFNGLALCRVR